MNRLILMFLFGLLLSIRPAFGVGDAWRTDATRLAFQSRIQEQLDRYTGMQTRVIAVVSPLGTDGKGETEMDFAYLPVPVQGQSARKGEVLKTAKVRVQLLLPDSMTDAMEKVVEEITKLTAEPNVVEIVTRRIAPGPLSESSNPGLPTMFWLLWIAVTAVGAFWLGRSETGRSLLPSDAIDPQRLRPTKRKAA